MERFIIGVVEVNKIGLSGHVIDDNDDSHNRFILHQKTNHFCSNQRMDLSSLLLGEDKLIKISHVNKVINNVGNVLYKKKSFRVQSYRTYRRNLLFTL